MRRVGMPAPPGGIECKPGMPRKNWIALLVGLVALTATIVVLNVLLIGDNSVIFFIAIVSWAAVSSYLVRRIRQSR